MKQHDLKPAPGSRRPRKRVGRGDSGKSGSYSGRGMKGQKSRSGGGTRPGFEGGQLPLIKRLPEQRGFVNIFSKKYSEVHLGGLTGFDDGVEITPDEMWKAGLIKKRALPVKVLSDGKVEKPIVVAAHKFSEAAKKKIVAAGGQVKELS